LSDIFVSQVELLRACLHTSVEFLVVTEKSIKFESTIQAVFHAATPNKLHAGVRDSSLHLVAIAFRCVIPMEAKCTFGGRASCRRGGAQGLLQHGIRPARSRGCRNHVKRSRDGNRTVLQTDATCKAPGPKVDGSGTKRGKNSTRWHPSAHLLSVT